MYKKHSKLFKKNGIYISSDSLACICLKQCHFMLWAETKVFCLQCNRWNEETFIHLSWLKMACRIRTDVCVCLPVILAHVNSAVRPCANCFIVPSVNTTHSHIWRNDSVLHHCVSAGPRHTWVSEWVRDELQVTAGSERRPWCPASRQR